MAGDRPEIGRGHTLCHYCLHNTQWAEDAALELSDTQEEELLLHRTLNTAAGEEQTSCDTGPARAQMEEQRIHEAGAPGKDLHMSQRSGGTLRAPVVEAAQFR